MSVMSDMSKAIRTVIQERTDPRNGTLKDLSMIDLMEIENIVTAYSLDLKQEIDRRRAEER